MPLRVIITTILLGCIPALLLTSCSTVKQSNPSRTATEEMLISTAADRAAIKLTPHVPKDAKVFIDASNFEGTDSKYAVGSIRSSLLMQGNILTDDKKTADIIVEIRAGALSTDEKDTLFGIPSFTVPVPLSSTGLTTPELAFYKASEQKGIAKFAATVYDAKSMRIADTSQDPQYGFSHDTKNTALFFISWEDNDAVPDEDDVIQRNVHLTSDKSDAPANGPK